MTEGSVMIVWSLIKMAGMMLLLLQLEHARVGADFVGARDGTELWR
jgi:hypothetical protein